MIHSLAFEIMILTRVVAACVLGSAIGLERELTNKFAGLRTHILVCLGSCIFTILSIYAFPMAVDSTNPQAFGDPARIAAQILTGIGFIGGGTVLRHGSSVYGLTTAATLWVAAAIGMACGTGMLDVAGVATIFSVIVLVLIRLFEKNVLINNIKNTKRVKIVTTCSSKYIDKIHTYILDNFKYIHEISKNLVGENNETIKVTAIVDISGKRQIQSLYKEFQGLEGLDSIVIQEDDE